MQPSTSTLLLLALALSAACAPAGDNTGEGEGETAGQPLVYTDAGIPDRPDAPPDGGVDVCYPVAPVPDADLPRCLAATRDCIAACPADATADACHNACWANDPTPATAAGTNCSGCVFAQLLACVDTHGCHDAVSTYLCCVVDACAGGAPGCDQQCANDANAMFQCGFVQSPQCFDLTGGDIGRCYAATDPPPPDAGPAADGGA